MIYLSGQFVESSDAHIAPEDRGFLLGDGLFETIRCYQGVPFAFAAHWQRLQKGAEALAIPLPITATKTQAVITELLKKHKLSTKHASVRITLTRGPGPRGLLPPSEPKSTVLISCAPITTIIAPVKLMKSCYTRNDTSPLSCFKTVNYLDSIMAKTTAKQQGFDDAILLNTRGDIVCTSAANIFFVSNKNLITPGIDCGALPGVTREIVIQLAKQLKLSCEITQCDLSILQAAEAAFMTNTIIEICPITQIDNAPFVEAHPTVKTLQQAYQDHVTATQGRQH